ncbi:MAG: hypothetical protein COB15_11235 [Flavobacteriales bacterium]|nr:MAG: hypothetical protein COB15_11235 [Flavobacteriales bacterium]
MGDNNKLFSIILISLLGLSALLTILFFAGVVSEGLLITWCYILLGIAVVVTLGFSVLGMAQNPKNAKNALIGVAALVLICVVAYFMSSNEVHSNMDGDILADPGTSQLAEGGLIAFYILAAVAIGSIVFTEISKGFK